MPSTVNGAIRKPTESDEEAADGASDIPEGWKVAMAVTPWASSSSASISAR